MKGPVFWMAAPEIGVVVSPVGVFLDLRAGEALLHAYNSVVSPVPMRPWPSVLPSLDDVIEARRQLHAALLLLSELTR